MKNPAAVSLGKDRFKTPEEAHKHMKLVRAKRWNSKTDEEKKAVGQFLKEARERARLAKMVDDTNQTIIVAPEGK